MSKLTTKFSNGITLVPVAADPVDAQNGDIIYRSDLNKFRKYENGAWSDMSAEASSDFSDADFRIQNDADDTKQIAFSATSIATGTTRTISMPDSNVDLGNIQVALDNAANAESDAALALSTANQAILDAADANSNALGAQSTADDAAAAIVVIQDELVNIDASVDALVVLSGVANEATNLGEFTGDIIPDDSDIKTALQSLETAVEAAAGASSFSDANFNIYNQADPTKEVFFDLSGAITGEPSYITMPGGNVDLGQIGLSTIAISDLVSLSGVGPNETSLGSFSGSIIPDGQTVKQALQALETYVEGIPDPISYRGTWNASTNTPALANADTGVSGFLYQVTVAGSVDFGAGAISFDVGDKVVNNGTAWEKWDMTDAVSSVNGQTGAVSLGLSDLDDVNVGTPGDGDVLTWDAGTSEWVASPAAATGANTSLSNLTTTSINQNLLPSADLTRNLGSASLKWAQTFTEIAGVSASGGRAIFDTGNVALATSSGFGMQVDSAGVQIMRAAFRRNSDNTGGDDLGVVSKYYSKLALAANTAAWTTITSSGGSGSVQTFAAIAQNISIKANYTIIEASTGAKRTGTITAAYDGTNMSYTDSYNETAAIGAGLELQVIAESSNYVIQFRNTGASNACTFYCDISRYQA